MRHHFISEITLNIYKRLSTLLNRYRIRVMWAMLGMLGAAATEPMLPAILKPLLDNGFAGKADFSLWVVPATIIGMFVLRGMCAFTTNYMLSWVSNKVLGDLRQQMFDRILRVPISFYYEHAHARILNTMMYEVQQIVEMIRVSLNTLIRDSLTVVALLIYLLYLNWQLTLIAFGLMPLVALLVRLVSKRLRQLNKAQQQCNAELTQTIEEAVRANIVIRVFGGEQYEQTRFLQKSEKLRGYSMRMTVASSATSPITQIMAACAVALVVVIALIQSNQNQTTVGGFVAFITAMLMLLTPLKHLADLNGPLQRGLTAAESVFSLIDAPLQEDVGTSLLSRAKGELIFEGVHFKYPTSESCALTNINLHINPGETVALVGMSGSGKSSLVNLVPRFYSPTAGRIVLDGIALDDIALTSLRSQMAMVSQHVVLFDDTIAANIAYGDMSPNIARIKEAARIAHLSDVISALPQGLDTMIGDNGMCLSGGQRQRLAIARAVYKDAPILILDEATSALDSESERAVQDSLATLMQGRTTLVIAHRLSTILSAHRIVVLAEGKIVETGSHQELLLHNGVYANLYHLQFAKEDEV